MRLALLLSLVWVAPLCFGGVVRTLDGKTLYGHVRLEGDGQITLILADGKGVRVALADLLSVHFRATALGVDVRQQARWVGRDVGQPALAGFSRFDGDLLTVRASGADIAGARDQFHFVYQMLAGDGQIVARVTNVQLSSPKARAGLMIRAGLDHAAPCAMAAVSAAEGVQFHSRQRLSQQMVIRNGEGHRPPVWLKLVRRGQQISGYSSPDGEIWTLVASEEIALPASAMIGVAVCSANPAAVGAATIERLSVSTGILDESDPNTLPRGVMLRDGSFLAGEVRSADGGGLRLMREREVAIALDQAARLVLKPMKRDWAQRIPAGRPGVLLASGDYLECTFQRIDDGVRVSSVLFGQRRLAMEEVLAVVLQDPAARPAMHEVRLADGSVLLADRVAVEAGALRLATAGAGEVTASAEQLIELKAGALRQRALARMQPAAVHGPAEQVMVNALPGGLPMRLAGQAVENGIGLGAGAAVSYALNGEYRVLLAQAGVPQGVLPVNPVRLVILGDGRELVRSGPRTSLDDPLAVMVDVSGVRTLTLRLEAEGPGSVGVCMLLGEAAVVR